MSTLQRRIEDLESRPRIQPPDEEFLRIQLAAEALQREDRNLFDRYLDALETAPRLTLGAAMKQASPEERVACERLRELEALPLSELKRRAAS